MSKDNVKQMFGKMEKDATLKGKYADLMQVHQKETEKALVEKLIELGKTSGFAFAKDDLLAARAELIDKANSNKELSDGDLSSVAGGRGAKEWALDFSFANFGVGCAIASIVYEARDGAGECGRRFSTDGSRKC